MLIIILFYKGRIFMTLVFRSPKLVETIPNENPGPGAYKIQDAKVKNQQPSAPFLSKVEKSHKTMEECVVGPGSYFRQSYTLDHQNDNNLAVFKSKIDRFGMNPSSANIISKEKQFAQEFNDLMKKQKCEHSYKGKLIDLKLKKEKWEKINDVQILPSIPGMDRSFGYKIDEATNKLVSNCNPKIIFTQTAKSNEKEDFYFQRSVNSLSNPKKCIINSTSKRSTNELTHQLKNPKLNSYNSDKYFTILESCKKANNANAIQANLPRFSDNSPSKKDMLVLNKLKKQFQAYIDNKDIDLSQLQKSKLQQKSPVKIPHKSIQKVQTQCFLSKQSRFQQDKPNPSQSLKKDDTNNNSEEIKPPKRDSIVSQQKQKKKQPFELGLERFKPRHKEFLGPGTYQLKDEAFLHGVCLKQNGERFKTTLSNDFDTPGPGSYQVSQSEEKEKAKITFNKYRNNEYFNQIKMHKSKEHSMQDLYQQVGKHMNYLNKIEKLETKKKKNRINHHQKIDGYLNLERISQAKKILQDKLALSKQESEEKQNKVSQNHSKSSKYAHLYQYVKPDSVISNVGPGYYELRTTLDKKSFNKT